MGSRLREATTPLPVAKRVSQCAEIVERYKNFRSKSAHSRATVAQELALLRYLANLAVELGYCSVPKVKWNVPRPVAREPKLIDEAKFGRLILSVNPRQRAVLRWLWDCGARPNELLLIRRDAYRPDEGAVFVPTPKTGRRKGAESRLVIPTAEMIAAIEERDGWLDGVVAEGKGAFGTGPNQARAQLGSEWLFPGVDGKQMARNSYRPMLESAFRKAKIEDRDFYAFRHTFATRWLASGGDPVTLSKLMGTSVEMIARSYGHLDHNWVREIQDRMRGKPPKDPEVRESPRVTYAQFAPKAQAI